MRKRISQTLYEAVAMMRIDRLQERERKNKWQWQKLFVLKWLSEEFKPFHSWSCGSELAFGIDARFILSQLARFNWLVDLEFLLLKTFVHWNDWNKRVALWPLSSSNELPFLPKSVSSESVDLDVRTTFGCNECVDDVADWGGDLIGVEDGGSGDEDIGFGHTQRNFNSLSHVGQSNLLNCNWIFC